MSCKQAHWQPISFNAFYREMDMQRESLGPEYESCDWLVCDWKSSKWENFNWESWKLRVGYPLTTNFIHDLTNTTVRCIDNEHNDRTHFFGYHGGILSVELENTITISLVIKPGTIRMPDEDTKSESYDVESAELMVGSPVTAAFINDLTYTRVRRIERDDANKELLVVLDNTVSVHLCNKSAALSDCPRRRVEV